MVQSASAFAVPNYLAPLTLQLLDGVFHKYLEEMSNALSPDSGPNALAYRVISTLATLIGEPIDSRPYPTPFLTILDNRDMHSELLSWSTYLYVRRILAKRSVLCQCHSVDHKD